MRERMFGMGGQTAGPIGTKHGTWLHIDPWSVPGKVVVKVWSECRSRENGRLAPSTAE